MSISNFQEKFLGGGCAKFIIGFMAVVFVGSLLYLGQNRGRSDPSSTRSAADVAATVGNVEILSSAIDQTIQSRIQEQMAQMSMGGQPAPNLPLQYQASVAAAATSDMIKQAAGVYLARQNGADLSDDSVKKLLDSALDQQMQQARGQLVSEGKIKPNASPSEVDAAFAKIAGRSMSQIRSDQASQIESALKDPTKHEAVIAAAAQAFLADFYKKKVSVSDADLDASNASYEVKQILFQNEPGKPAAQQASAALADIRANKLSFEQAVDRYSKAPPAAGKRLSESTMTIPGSEIVGSPSYAALKGLKVGDVSNPIEMPDGVRVFKVVKITSNPPKDFATNKAMYRDRLAGQEASQLMSNDLRKALASSLVKWKSPGYEALFLYGQSLSDPALLTDFTKRTQAMQSIVDKAKAAIAAGGPDAKFAALAEYSAFSAIFNAPGADKTKLADEQIRVVNDVLQNNEDPQLRLELVDLYKQKKDADNASESLLSAAQSNNDFSAEGESLFHTIGKKMDELKTANLMPKTVEDQVLKELDRWRKDKADHDAEVAETKRLEEEEHKRAEADKKGGSSDGKKAPSTPTPTPKPSTKK